MITMSNIDVQLIYGGKKFYQCSNALDGLIESLNGNEGNKLSGYSIASELLIIKIICESAHDSDIIDLEQELRKFHTKERAHFNRFQDEV